MNGGQRFHEWWARVRPERRGKPINRADRLWAFAAALLLVPVLAEAIYIAVAVVPLNWELGQDFEYYRAVGERFLADGSYYLPRQLEGPYVVRLMEDVLYPPSALLLFVPSAIAPWFLWWAIPVGVTLYVLRWLNPKPWAWCVMLILLAWPRAIGAYLFGNTDMWALAGVCAGLRYGWPAVLLLLKPTFAPFAIIGIDRRRWWVAAALLGLASLPLLPLWSDYVTAAANMIIDPDYSLGSLPLLLVGVTAWLGSRNPEASRPSVPLLGRTTPRRLPPQ